MKFKSYINLRLCIFLIAIVISLFLPFIVTEFLLYVIVLSFITSILALSYDLVYGRTGILNFYWGIPYGVGAYMSALLNLRFGIPVWFSMVISAVIIAVLSAGVAAVALRLSEIFFWVTTWTLVIVMAIVFRAEADITGGPMGLLGIRPPESFLGIDFSLAKNYYYVVLVYALLIFFLIHKIANSNIGRIFTYIREDSILAESLGINTYFYKIVSFVLGTFFAGFAGSLYAHFYLYLNPSLIETSTIQVLGYAIIGGSGTTIGPIVGAFLMTILMEILRLTAETRLLLYACFVIGMILLFPRGLVGIIKKLLGKSQ